jgi:hypothetical protein
LRLYQNKYIHLRIETQSIESRPIPSHRISSHLQISIHQLPDPPTTTMRVTTFLLLTIATLTTASDYDLAGQVFNVMAARAPAITQCPSLPAQAMVIDSACTAGACDKGAKKECLGKQVCACCVSTVDPSMPLSTYAYCAKPAA